MNADVEHHNYYFQIVFDQLYTIFLLIFRKDYVNFQRASYLPVIGWNAGNPLVSGRTFQNLAG